MKAQRVVFVLMAAMLCIAAAGAHEGPGRIQTTLLAGQVHDVGVADVWNNGKKTITYEGIESDAGSKLKIDVAMTPGSPWLIANAQAFVGFGEIPTKNGNPVIGKFPQKYEFASPLPGAYFEFNLRDLVVDQVTGETFAWGRKYPRILKVAIHLDIVQLDAKGKVIAEEGAWAWAGTNAIPFDSGRWGWYFEYEVANPMRGHFIDSPVKGLSYRTPVDEGVTGDPWPFQFFPGDAIELWAGNVYLGSAEAAKKVSPLDIIGADTDDPRVVNMARLLQSLDVDATPQGSIKITPTVRNCLNMAAADALPVDFADTAAVEALIVETHGLCNGTYDPAGEIVLALSMPTLDEAQGNLEAGLNASGNFRKNISKTPEIAEDHQALDVMTVYLPGVRSNGDPSFCDFNGNGLYDEEGDQLGVPYEEWRLNGDPLAESCDPRDYDDPGACVVTIVDCREIAKPLIATYSEVVDIYDDQVTTDFWPGRFSNDIYTAISRDDGTTWKRMNVSRMADRSSFELETGEPFPGTCGSNHTKIDDNYILVVWQSKYCKSGNPRYAIDLCDDPATETVETPESGCALYCSGNPDQGTEVCEPDYPYDDPYYVTDIWGVRGQQQSVNYDEVDDVAELGIGEIPYSCLWAARGVIISQREIDDGSFASLNVVDDPETPDVDETRELTLGDIVWFKPERLTSGRRDAYIPTVGSGRGAGFAITWQEDPDGLRPGKGKGPGEGWSGSGSNHKTDMWYSYIPIDDFAKIDVNFVPGGPGDEVTGDEGYLDKPGLGRPKALVPFSLPVRISDNDMVNTDTLKVEQSEQCVTPPNGTESVCFPKVVDGTFVPMDPETIEAQFCDPSSIPVSGDGCCHPDYHSPDDSQYDADCEDMKGLYGNLTGTKRYAYLAKTIDEIDNATGLYVSGGDGTPDYQYFVDRGGTLDLCDTTGADSYMDVLPGTAAHERWFGFANVSGQSKLVCVTSDGRLLDGDVSASRPIMQLQPYTRQDGTKSAWVLLAYEETKGMGHSLAASEHDDDLGDEIIGSETDEHGQTKPIKQDLGKNLIYHSFDFRQPDLVSPGHLVNLPGLCGGLYPTWCDDPKTPDIIETNLENPACSCTPGEPVPLYFDYQTCTDTDPATCTWMPDDTKFLQYRTEIARRARFIVQGKNRLGPSGTIGTILFKQGQEGQGRPADVFIRRIVVPTTDKGYHNPYRFENFECTTYLDETFELPACPNGAGDKPFDIGYNCNVWGEAAGDRLCGGTFDETAPDGTTYTRRDHVNLTSADINLAVDAGPDDETPDDPTDDRYGTNKVLLWSQHEYNLGDESFGLVHDDGTPCDVLNGEVCPGMYSNARSHRGMIRRDALVLAFNLSPNWAAARNGNDRYNFYVRRSFDGGQTWTTTPGDLGGSGVYACPEWRADPNADDPDGSGHLPPEGIDPECDPCPYVEDGTCTPTDSAVFYLAGEFEPARNISEIGNNKESASDPRIGGLPEILPVDGTVMPRVPIQYDEDIYEDGIYFAAWGTADNEKFTGGGDIGGEIAPLDVYYTRTSDWGDTYLKVPWDVNGTNSNQYGETVWRYQKIAWGDEEQGECQLKATSDGSKAYVVYLELIEDATDEEWTRWYPWELEFSHDHDVWFRRLIFWPEDLTPAEP